MDKDSPIYRVIFQPSGQSVEVPDGTTIAEAAIQAGVFINQPCAGQGRCGRCKVQIVEGPVKRRSVTRLTQEELDQGYALSCQTLVEGDVVVFVPPQEVALRKPPTERKPGVQVTLPVECDWQTRPAIRKIPLFIEPPSLADNTTDFERLKRELARQHDIYNVIADLPVLRKLARALRDSDWYVTAVLEMYTWLDDEEGTPHPRLIDLRPGDQSDRTWGVAIDIGTTSNVIYLVDMDRAVVVDIASAYNKQISCGEDIISRIIYATKREHGLQHLQSLVMETLNGLLEELAARNDIATTDIDKVTVAGNTTMIHLFLGLNPEHIRLEPYIPTVTHPLPVKAAELGLKVNPEATVDCLPGVGAYVGADITAGVLSSRMYETDKLTMFIDVGTNGEIVLGNSDWLLSCACSAGPAFEGSGVHSGMRATTGAIEEVWIDDGTYEPTIRVIGDGPPLGICGSGMISLLAEMFLTGVIDKAGKINRDLKTPRVRIGEHGPEYVVAWAEESGNKRDIVITEVDIANLLRAKAAIYAGFSVLTRSVGLDLSEVEQFYIGGAFGKYIDIEKAIQIGLLPDMPWEKFQYLGNTSALGAYTALVCPDMRREVVEIANRMTYLELSADNTFYDEFTRALFLPHTDISAFPSVARLLEAQRRKG